MAIYSFRQNNSGGWFHVPAITVYVHADTPEQANAVAEANGLYFHGVSKGLDCECCGDRWYPADDYYLVEDLDEDIARRAKWDTQWAKSDDVPIYVVVGG